MTQSLSFQSALTAITQQLWLVDRMEDTILCLQIQNLKPILELAELKKQRESLSKKTSLKDKREALRKKREESIALKDTLLECLKKESEYLKQLDQYTVLKQSLKEEIQQSQNSLESLRQETLELTNELANENHSLLESIFECIQKFDRRDKSDSENSANSSQMLIAWKHLQRLLKTFISTPAFIIAQPSDSQEASSNIQESQNKAKQLLEQYDRAPNILEEPFSKESIQILSELLVDLKNVKLANSADEEFLRLWLVSFPTQLNFVTQQIAKHLTLSTEQLVKTGHYNEIELLDILKQLPSKGDNRQLNQALVAIAEDYIAASNPAAKDRLAEKKATLDKNKASIISLETKHTDLSSKLKKLVTITEPALEKKTYKLMSETIPPLRQENTKLDQEISSLEQKVSFLEQNIDSEYNKAIASLDKKIAVIPALISKNNAEIDFLKNTTKHVNEILLKLVKRQVVIALARYRDAHKKTFFSFTRWHNISSTGVDRSSRFTADLLSKTSYKDACLCMKTFFEDSSQYFDEDKGFSLRDKSFMTFLLIELFRPGGVLNTAKTDKASPLAFICKKANDFHDGSININWHAIDELSTNGYDDASIDKLNTWLTPDRQDNFVNALTNRKITPSSDPRVSSIMNSCGIFAHKWLNPTGFEVRDAAREAAASAFSKAAGAA